MMLGARLEARGPKGGAYLSGESTGRQGKPGLYRDRMCLGYDWNIPDPAAAMLLASALPISA